MCCFGNELVLLCWEIDSVTDNVEKKNRRVRITIQAIRDALFELLKHTPIEKVTVSSICRLADINRSTFYVHYRDAYDLLNRIEEEFFDTIGQTLRFTKVVLPSVEMLTPLFTVVYDNRDLCEAVFRRQGNRDFLQRIGNIQREMTLSAWTDKAVDFDQNLVHYLYAFSSYVNIGVLEQWILGGFRETPEQLAAIVTHLLMHGFTGFLKKKA